jgi:hypothetical protein
MSIIDPPEYRNACSEPVAVKDKPTTWLEALMAHPELYPPPREPMSFILPP